MGTATTTTTTMELDHNKLGRKIRDDDNVGGKNINNGDEETEKEIGGTKIIENGKKGDDMEVVREKLKKETNNQKEQKYDSIMGPNFGPHLIVTSTDDLKAFTSVLPPLRYTCCSNPPPLSDEYDDCDDDDDDDGDDDDNDDINNDNDENRKNKR